MRFKTDENLPQELAQALCAEGWDAISVYDQTLGGAEDAKVAAICAAESRTLITLDIGFGNIKAYPPGDYAGIIVLRLRQQDKSAVLEVARRLIASLRQRSIANGLWIVDKDRIRVRS